MQSILAFLAISSLGVMFGWRPMPDGSPQYEYVVQIEPELLATMKEGTTIPIASEVPDDIRPIARIRIMVGSGELPRERLAGEFKPLPSPESREGLIETQYVTPVAGSSQAPRYEDQQILPPGNNSGQILPPSSRPQSADNGFGQTLQRSAEQARNTASQGDILPPSNEIRPAQSSPRYSQPIEASNQQSGNQSDISRLFGAGPSNSQGNLQQVDDRSSPVTTSSPPILPAPRTNTNTATSTADDWRANDASTAANRFERLDEPVTAAPVRDTRQAERTAAPAASAPGVFNAPWPPLERFADAPLAQDWNSRNAQDNRTAAQPATTSSTNPAAWPDNNSRSNSSAFDIADRSTSGGVRPASDSLSFPAPQNGTAPGDRLQSPSPAPEIRRDMLEHPANDSLVTASGEPVRPTPASFPVGSGQPTGAQAPIAQFPTAQPQTAATNQLALQPEPSAGANSNSKAFPLLLAWVLLSGSGAGNLYLFWSYLDIRHKYRGLVRTARRKLGRRIPEETDDEDYED